MISMYDKVKIKDKNIDGTVIDTYTVGNSTMFVVESDVPNINEGYGGKWKLFDCDESELILI